MLMNFIGKDKKSRHTIIRISNDGVKDDSALAQEIIKTIQEHPNDLFEIQFDKVALSFVKNLLTIFEKDITSSELIKAISFYNYTSPLNLQSLSFFPIPSFIKEVYFESVDVNLLSYFFDELKKIGKKNSIIFSCAPSPNIKQVWHDKFNHFNPKAPNSKKHKTTSFFTSPGFHQESHPTAHQQHKPTTFIDQRFVPSDELILVPHLLNVAQENIADDRSHIAASYPVVAASTPSSLDNTTTLLNLSSDISEKPIKPSSLNLESLLTIENLSEDLSSNKATAQFICALSKEEKLKLFYATLETPSPSKNFLTWMLTDETFASDQVNGLYKSLNSDLASQERVKYLTITRKIIQTLNSSFDFYKSFATFISKTFKSTTKANLNLLKSEYSKDLTLKKIFSAAVTNNMPILVNLMIEKQSCIIEPVEVVALVKNKRKAKNPAPFSLKEANSMPTPVTYLPSPPHTSNPSIPKKSKPTVSPKIASDQEHNFLFFLDKTTKHNANTKAIPEEQCFSTTVDTDNEKNIRIKPSL